MNIPKDFTLIETGGRCTAWLHTSKRYMITKPNGLNHPGNPVNPCMVGIYNKNLEYEDYSDFENLECALKYIKTNQLIDHLCV